MKETAILLTNELSRAIDDQAGDTARNVFQKRGIILGDLSADETGQTISMKSEEKLAIPDNDPEGVVSRLSVEQDGKLRDRQSAYGPLADDPDVVAQTYFMTVLESIAPSPETDEAGAVFLGTADYFACSYTGDPKLGEKFAQVTRFGMDSIRNLGQLVHIRDATDLWTRSLVWSGACWELREQFGGDALNESVRVVITKVGRDTSMKEAAILLTS